MRQAVVVVIAALFLSGCLDGTVKTRPVPKHEETAQTQAGQRGVAEDFLAWMVGNMVMPY
jgi:uncharacterized protein YceK